MRHKLALHREVRLVRANGIGFKLGRDQFRYRGAEIGHLIGQRVVCGFDPENSDVLTAEDPKTGLVHCVAVHEKGHPAHAAPDCIVLPSANELAAAEKRAAEKLPRRGKHSRGAAATPELPPRAAVAAVAPQARGSLARHAATPLLTE